ncbi:hypothetical protein BJ322DRAFT_1064553 [Thelephora terrestris]|uniref:Uncharacterized protein n=1 Tax=Thelephora terrestris TaxID=56493 RepID=A0A9P6L6I2_9AGAM|nr:hypothetical protein BJ322DRAFT_1064553 [Thelephora terrestris]
MSQNTQLPSSSSQKDTAALVTSSIALNSHLINRSLDGLLEVLSSDKVGDWDIGVPLDRIGQELDSLVLTRGKDEEEIRSLLQSVLDQEVVEYLTLEIQKRADEYINQKVSGLVESFLDVYVPKSLRERVEGSCDELGAVHVQLHNIEARRQNASIKTMRHLEVPIRHILNEAGGKSELSPPSVGQLLELDDKELSALVMFYGKGNSGKKCDDINWYLKFSGVTFRYVHG